MTEEEIKQYLAERGWPHRVADADHKELVRRWKDFVKEVGDANRTQRWSIDDYTIFLYIRDTIHDIGCDELVREDDEEFRGLLTAMEIRHPNKKNESDYDFWNCGYPKNAEGFFWEQIQRHILRKKP